MAMPSTREEAQRLEELWGGEFGNAYIERNKDVGKRRGTFWGQFLAEFPVERVLEVGCNVGINLQWLTPPLAPANVYGIDINEKALQILRERLPGVNVRLGQAQALPFDDGFFDLVFTAGVLIHQPEETLLSVMREIVRCSSKYVFCSEYFSEKTVEVPYRGQAGALFKRDYGALYQKHFPALKLLKKGFLTKADDWDDETFWVFEKREA